jgi:dihydroflavonol-4-reductase
MKAFITGATGFLGIHLVHELAAAGWDLTIFHRKGSDLTELLKIGGLNYAIGDVRDKESLERAMPEGLDAVFHAAGSVGFLDPKVEASQYEINELGARNVVEVATRKKPRRIIYTSTVLTYDWSGRIDERSPPNTSSKYAYVHSKYLAELEMEKGSSSGLDIVYIHPSAIFGAHDKATWSKMFREIQRGLNVPAAPPGRATFCHMRKVAAVHLAAFHRGRKGEHYVLGGVDASYLEIARKIAALLVRPGPRLVIPGLLFRIAGRVEYRLSTWLGKEPMLTPHMADILCEDILCSSQKAVDELGYAPSSLDTMLIDCYQWMVREKMLPAAQPGVGSGCKS